MMNARLGAILVLVALVAIAFTTRSDGPTIGPESSGILEFQAGPLFQDKTIPIHYYLPPGDQREMPIQIVLHGASRNADDYLAGWTEKARQYGVIILAPEFSKDQFSIGEYTHGQLMDSLLRINPPEQTLFALIDQMFAHAKSALELGQEQYNLFGHSAGGQFVHRYLQFYDSPALGKAIAANAGWYTFPDEAIEYPYGISGMSQDYIAFRARYYAKDLTILLGTADTLRTNNLRVNPEADRQGPNRLERGKYFFAANRENATAAGQLFNWKIAYVPEAGHQHQLMSAAAAELLYGAGGQSH
jgi:pimeloyl-ACP methyl ester carboxylesterase